MKKIALITGATSGIGKAYAYALAQKSYDLVLVGRRSELLEQTAQDLYNKFKTHVVICLLDLKKDNDFAKFLEWIDKKDNIDVLINNAGYGLENSFITDHYPSQAEMLKVHVERTLQLSHLIGNKMKNKRDGIIINICSLAAYIPLASSAMYASTKSFLVTFTECLALELEPYSVSVQAVCPGFVHTDFHKKIAINKQMHRAMHLIPFMSSKEVVDYSLRMLNNKNMIVVIPGRFNKMAYILLKSMPKKVYYGILRKK